MPNKPVALITGCSDPSSLGAALALNLVKRGWHVLASAPNLDDMVDLAKQGCKTIQLDVTNKDDIAAAKLALGHRLDLLINNAAVEGLAPLIDTDRSHLESMFRINVYGPLALVQAFADPLLESKGCIVNIGSVGVYGLPFHGAYAGSEAALQSMSDVLRRELAPLGVKVLTVELGMVMTPMLRFANPFTLAREPQDRHPAFTKWYTDISPLYGSDIEKRYPNAMSAGQAADEIVSRVVRGDGAGAGGGGKIWVGAMAWIFRWMWGMLSTSRQDKINGDLLHVDMLRKG